MTTFPPYNDDDRELEEELRALEESRDIDEASGQTAWDDQSTSKACSEHWSAASDGSRLPNTSDSVLTILQLTIQGRARLS
jgi:hypothetical protein